MNTPLAAADHRHGIQEARREFLDLDAEDAGGADRWPTGALDAVGDRLPEAVMADPLQLAGRAQPGLHLADRQRDRPGSSSRVGQATTSTSAAMLPLGEVLVAELGTQGRRADQQRQDPVPGHHPDPPGDRRAGPGGAAARLRPRF